MTAEDAILSAKVVEQDNALACMAVVGLGELHGKLGVVLGELHDDLGVIFLELLVVGVQLLVAMLLVLHRVEEHLYICILCCQLSVLGSEFLL